MSARRNYSVYPAISAEMTKQDLSLGDLADRIGISYSSLSLMLNGTKVPSGQMRQRITEALGRKQVGPLFKLSDDVQRLIDSAVDQGFAPRVDNPHVLQGISHFLIAQRDEQRRAA